MTNFASIYEMDPEASLNGRWIPFYGDGECLIARGNNKNAQALRAELVKQYESTRPGFRKRAGQSLTDEQEEEIGRKVLAGAILLDMRGWEFTDEQKALLKSKYGVQVRVSKGKVQYTPELGEALFQEYEDFQLDVIRCAADEEGFRKARLEDDLGNSPEPSSGGGGGEA